MEGAVTEGGFGAGGLGGSPAGDPPLRPLGVGETLDRAIKLYRGDAVTLWKIVAIVIVPLQLIDVIVRRVSLPSDVYLSNGNLYSFSGQSTGQTIAVLLAALLLLVGSLVSTGAAFRSLIDAYLGHPADWRSSLQHAQTRFWSLLWLSILTAVLAFIGFILLIIPGLWFVVSVSVAVPVLMFEGQSGFAAMKRSIDLVDTRWWATFGRLLAAYVLLGVLLFGFSALASALGSGITNVTLFVVLSGVLSALGSILVWPFVAAVISVIYVDLRVRKEALDLELLAGGFDRPVGPPAAAPPSAAAAPPAAAPPPAAAAPPPAASTPPPPAASTPPAPPATAPPPPATSTPPPPPATAPPPPDPTLPPAG